MPHMTPAEIQAQCITNLEIEITDLKVSIVALQNKVDSQNQQLRDAAKAFEDFYQRLAIVEGHIANRKSQINCPHCGGLYRGAPKDGALTCTSCNKKFNP